MKHLITTTLAAGLVVATFSVSSFAQTPKTLPKTLIARQAAARAEATVPLSGQGVAAMLEAGSAEQTKELLDRLLERHPPLVRRILRLDPSLLTNADYLEAYPDLSVFIQQHPEVLRNPSFFFGAPEYFRQATSGERALNLVEGIAAGTAVFTGLMIALGVVYSLLRELLHYRRWARQSRVQTEVHTKLMDRLTSNEDLLAYIQTTAGRRFLEAAPIATRELGGAVGAPVNRLLWSLQAGIVLMALGGGLWIAQNGVVAEVAPAFSVMGTIAIAAGLGFAASAVACYLLSLKLGLFAPAVPESESR